MSKTKRILIWVGAAFFILGMIAATTWCIKTRNDDIVPVAVETAAK